MKDFAGNEIDVPAVLEAIASIDWSRTNEAGHRHMSEHGLRQFTCAGCGWTSSDIGTFPNLAIPLCCTCDSDARHAHNQT